MFNAASVVEYCSRIVKTVIESRMQSKTAYSDNIVNALGKLSWTAECSITDEVVT